MLTRVEIVVDGKPKGKGRPREGQGRFYTPKETEAEEAHVRKLTREAMAGRAPAVGPVRVTLEAVFEMPQSWPARLRERSSGLAYIGKPDLDNIEKLYLDALNGVAFLDDAQVCEVLKRKRYGEGQRVHIIIEELVTASDHPGVKRNAERVLEEAANPRGRKVKKRRAPPPATFKAAPIGKRLK